jgi:CCR4-NOT transcription complex subunit 1
VAKSSLQAKLLSEEIGSLLNKSSLVSNLCFAIDNCFHHQKTLKPGPNLFNQITKALNLSPIKELAVALALQHSINPELSKLADHQLKICLPNLIQSYIELGGY